MDSPGVFLAGMASADPRWPKPPRRVAFQVALPDLPDSTPTGLHHHFRSVADLAFRLLRRVFAVHRRYGNIQPVSHRLRLNGLGLGAD